MEIKEIIDGVQTGSLTMLDYVLLQEELKEKFISSMGLKGKTLQELTPEDATEWLTEYEEQKLYIQ